jgi:selenocysteine-specific elongation factor
VIVATAGHVDHGKTSLVRALTGVDTDRLPEEKRRGMTIDLGFAYSKALGFVDVPGHERFIHNMLCGVAGIDFVLFVVAADDGPMPQTREHLAILDLLGVARGAVALTKIDRVPPERIHEVKAQIEALLAPTLLAGAPLYPVSSLQGDGLAELARHLEEASAKTTERKTGANFRLSVDRCFTVAGAGLVVTGTAMSGEVSLGDEVQVLLLDSKARVRSIHAHNAPAQRGRAGQRLALNLAGLDAKARIARGDWIVRGAVPAPVSRFDARLKTLEPLKHWTPVHVHLGAADVLGRVALLDDSARVQLVLERPLGALHGDRFIVRDASARRTLGGGSVIDVFPRARGRAKPERLAHLAAMELEDDDAALGALLAQSPHGVDLARFAANRNRPAASGWRFSDAHWNALRDQALKNLADWHARFPDAVGPAEDRLLKGVAGEALAALVDELAREGAIVREALGVRLASHRVELGPADLALWKKVEPQLAALRPPTVAELAAVLEVEPRRVETTLSRAGRQGLVIRVSKNRFFLPAFLKSLEGIAHDVARSGAGITAAAFRDRAGIGRNVSIEVLEYFDRIKFTRRVGDAHVLTHTPHGRDSHPGGAHGLQIR